MKFENKNDALIFRLLTQTYFNFQVRGYYRTKLL